MIARAFTRTFCKGEARQRFHEKETVIPYLRKVLVSIKLEKESVLSQDHADFYRLAEYREGSRAPETFPECF